MQNEIIQRVRSRLSDPATPAGTEITSKYPTRSLPEGAAVTRLAPSPTGFVHIGTVYAALINERIAHQSGGVFMLRIEDTDKKREVEGGVRLLQESLDLFGLIPDEGPLQGGSYGPYVQSERQSLYRAYAIQLLESGRAYPCFATVEELHQAHELQLQWKHRTGYYGQYALWRDRPIEEVIARLDANEPFVLRFKSLGDHQQRITVVDALKGSLTLPQNDLDIPLIKSDGLPTYHLAHVIDDHLMGTTLVLRGEEWLPSMPLHIELAEALSIKPFMYAHFAAISILDNGKKRKLSKRKDAEADVASWLADGYPPEAVIEYLMTLANSNFEDWRKANPFSPYQDFPFSIKKLSMSRAPLLDMKKLEDVSRNVIAEMQQVKFEHDILGWLKLFDQDLHAIMAADPAYTTKVLTIEREGANRRKDISKWSQARAMYGYFYDELYQPGVADAIDTNLPQLEFTDRQQICETFLDSYDPSDDQPTWLTKFRAAAEKSGFAADTKQFQSSPEKFKGSLADFAKVIRVLLTTSNRSPDLYAIMQIMGTERIRRRLLP